MFNPTSRYFTIEKAEWEAPNGQRIPYVRRRFVPPSVDVVAIAEHRVTAGDRLDNVTARYLGDPQQFWRIADANGAMRAEELTADNGRLLVIPMPSVE